MSASAAAVTAAVRACPEGNDWLVTATSDPGGRGRSTSAFTGPMDNSAHNSAAANTVSGRHRRQMARSAAMTSRTTQMTVPPAATLSTFATDVPGAERTSSTHLSHWSSAACTHGGLTAMMLVSTPATARHTRPTSAQPGSGSLTGPLWPLDRLSVTSPSRPGWLTGMVALNCEYCP